MVLKSPQLTISLKLIAENFEYAVENADIIFYLFINIFILQMFEKDMHACTM